MEVAASLTSPPETQILTPLRSRSSYSATIFQTKLSVLLQRDYSSSAATTSSDDLEMISLKSTVHGYTSLKDVISPSSVGWSSPISGSGGDIGIRNRLVKQAAWAYLQPMSSSPMADEGGSVFHRLWRRFATIVDSVRWSFFRVVNWALRVFRIRGPR